MSKNKRPPAKGFGSGSNSGEPEEVWMRTCMMCGLQLSDDMLRGVVVDPLENSIGVACISCCEADQDAIKFGTPNNPLFGKD
jgi:hypothetical protein